MMLGHEFKDPTLRSVSELGPDMVGWWLAFFKYKNELENTPTKVRNANKGLTKTTPKRRRTV